MRSKYEEYFVLFNSKEISREIDLRDDEFFITKFEVTPKLPIYTLAVLVADFEIFEFSGWRLTGPYLTRDVARDIFEVSKNISDGLRLSSKRS